MNTLVNLKEDSDWEQVRELLAACMYPNEEKINRQVVLYQSDEFLLLYGVVIQSELVGLIGVSVDTTGKGVLRHIAVKPNHRGQGIGHTMIKHMMQIHNLIRLEAETDRDAVGFYQRAGFDVACLGEKYPGVERFLCVLKNELSSDRAEESRVHHN